MVFFYGFVSILGLFEEINYIYFFCYFFYCFKRKKVMIICISYYFMFGVERRF